SLLRADVARGVARLRDLSAPVGDAVGKAGAGTAVPGFLARAGAILLPSRDRQRMWLESRLIQAGIYNPAAASAFLGAKLLLVLLLPVVAGLGLYLSGFMSPQRVLSAGLIAAGCGVIIPGLWLDYRTKKYQSSLRRALPDALDLLVLCVEGGSSLAAAIQRITEDLEVAHPHLTAEMTIVQREMQLGLSAGAAIKRFGERCDLEDVRDL